MIAVQAGEWAVEEGGVGASGVGWVCLALGEGGEKAVGDG